ncbi:MAG: segregation/condensation protein A [Patescibacteria group bacterium]
MSYSVHIEKFEGPLDLLLQLVEAEKMEITEVSLVQVTEPFVRHVREQQGVIPPEELADFLVIAAKLIYLKSKALLPSITDEALEEGPDLATQLRMYQRFVEAARFLGELDRRAQRSYSGPRRTAPIEAGFYPPKKLTPDMLRDSFRRVIKWIQPITQLTRASVERVVTIEEKIKELSARIASGIKGVSFRELLGRSHDRAEAVVSFLALLELIKQRVVKASQGNLFEDINLEAQ